MCALLIFQKTSFDQPLTRISPWLDTLTEPLDSVVRTLESRRTAASSSPTRRSTDCRAIPREVHLCGSRSARRCRVVDASRSELDVERLINLRIEAVGLDDLERAAAPSRAAVRSTRAFLVLDRRACRQDLAVQSCVDAVPPRHVLVGASGHECRAVPLRRSVTRSRRRDATARRISRDRRAPREVG